MWESGLAWYQTRDGNSQFYEVNNTGVPLEWSEGQSQPTLLATLVLDHCGKVLIFPV